MNFSNDRQHSTAAGDEQTLRMYLGCKTKQLEGSRTDRVQRAVRTLQRRINHEHRLITNAKCKMVVYSSYIYSHSVVLKEVRYRDMAKLRGEHKPLCSGLIENVDTKRITHYNR